jgi:excisionase family DNA binding protein
MAETSPLTLTVPEAGKRYFNLSRNAAYAAAARGELPVVRIGRLLRVPVKACERMLEQADTGIPAHPAA